MSDTNFKLNYIKVKVNEHFIDSIVDLREIAKCKGFTEYVSPLGDVFVRIEDDIQKDDYVLMFVEPQINMTATARAKGIKYKLQISIGHDYEERYRGLKVSRYENLIPFKSFLQILNTCDDWSERLADVLKQEDGQFTLIT